MALSDAIATRNARVTVYADLVDGGAGAGQLLIYSGSAPAVDSAATGDLLATLTLNDPAFGAAASGVITLDVDPAISAAASATGTAGYGRLVDSTGAVVTQGTVTATGGGGDFEINSTSITSGQTVNLTGGTITQS